MAENIVSNLKSQVANLTVLCAALAEKMGLDLEAPKTSAAESTPVDNTTSLKSKRNRAEPIHVTLTQAMFDGRMKLPARIFTKGKKVVINGHTITQQEADQGRSTKFNPEIFGLGVDVGDTLIFEHEGGREWTVEAEHARRGGRKASKTQTSTKASKAPAKRGRPAKNQSDDDDDDDEAPAKSSTRVARTGAVGESLKAGIKRFADICIENANTKGFKQNENIKQTGAFDVDARVYLDTRQNQQFRSWRKKQGLTLKKAVSLLNAEVFEM